MSATMHRIVGFLLLVSAGWAHGSPIVADGREWLQPADFLGLSWNGVNDACNPAVDGRCTGEIGGFDLQGWTWASVEDMQALFNFYIGSDELGPELVSVFSEVGTDWAGQIFADGFRETATFANGALGIYGWTRTLVPGTVNPAYTAGAAWLENTLQNQAQTGGVSENQVDFVLFGGPIGVWFYREPESVPAPSTLVLLALGLWLMGLSRRRCSS